MKALNMHYNQLNLIRVYKEIEVKNKKNRSIVFTKSKGVFPQNITENIFQKKTIDRTLIRIGYIRIVLQINHGEINFKSDSANQ